ncbi:hypothetical protein M405DRAFT_580378 [Rhizopogon salebrosus TDB-379]|nr:hypothetical protein M405DRAFT_580378 [Rhizopogon salebrosus TDB-379]
MYAADLSATTCFGVVAVAMPEIPDLTFQITRPVDEDVTRPTPDSERCIWRAQFSEVDVRVKKLFKSRSDWRNSLDNTAVARDLLQWHKVRHSNVVSVFGILQRDLTPFLVTPWIAGGNLNVFLTQHDQFLSPVDCISLIRDVAAGLHCLHSLSIVHGSLIGVHPNHISYDVS